MRIASLTLFAALFCIAAALPPMANAGNKTVEISPGRLGWRLLDGTHISTSKGRWNLRFRILVNGPRGAAYTIISQHGSFEDALELLEFLQKQLNKIAKLVTSTKPVKVWAGGMKFKTQTYYELRDIALK